MIDDEHLLDSVQGAGAQLERRLTERFGNHRHVGDIRGRGLFRAIELVADRASETPFDPALKLNQRIKAAAFERGLACYPWAGPSTAAAATMSCWRRPILRRRTIST